MLSNVRLAALAALLGLFVACSGEKDPTTGSAGPAGATTPSSRPASAPLVVAPPTSSGGTAAARAGSPAPSVAGGEAVASQVAVARPAVREITLPTGTPLSLRLETPIASDQSRVEETVRATVAKPVVIDGVTVIPIDAEVIGTVVEANESGRVKGRASLAFRFQQLRAWDETVEISTARIARVAPATKGEDAQKVAIGAGAGAVIGAIAGGKKGAAIGGAVGAGAGTGAVLATRGEEVRLGRGAAVRATLTAPVTLRVPLGE